MSKGYGNGTEFRHTEKHEAETGPCHMSKGYGNGTEFRLASKSHSPELNSAKKIKHEAGT